MKLIGSLSFRLTLLYAVIFSASIGLILAAYYMVSVRGPMEAVKAEIQANAEEAVRRAGNGGTPALARVLDRRAVTQRGRTPYHILLSKEGKLVTKNLPSWPAFEGRRWLMIEADTYRNGEDNDHMALVLDQRLGDGKRLMVGLDIEDLRQRQATLFDAARWLIIGGVLFGLLGGILMSRAIGDRIEAITSTARRVMSGDFFDRIPTYGSGDDFDRLAETLNLMLTRIQDLLDSIRRVSDGVAHELRTPLARLHADLSDLRGSLSQEKRPLVDAAVEEAEKVISLFDAVLRIGRIESIRDNIEMSDVDLSQLLADAVEIFGPSAEEKRLQLKAAIAPELRIQGNSNLLFQAVGNILDNAIKYSPAGGRVKLVAVAVAQEVSLCVTDNGAGIPPDQRMDVFDRFVRLPQTSDVPGLGLGLSFVKAVVDAHHSAIHFEDAGPGLRVTWNFPTTDPASDRMAMAVASADSGALAVLRRSDPRGTTH